MRSLFIFGLIALSGCALGQWTVARYDDGNGYTSFESGFGDQVGGLDYISPAYWPSGPGSLVRFYTDLAHSGVIYGLSATLQVGDMAMPTHGVSAHAYIWSGSAGSGRDLHPAAYSESHIFSLSGSQMGGLAVINQHQHAALWAGAAHTFADLTPPGDDLAEILGVSAVDQVGWNQINSQRHAYLWHGTSDSYVDLNPAGSNNSFALFTDGSREVGVASFSGSIRVGYWTGTPESWTDITPGGNFNTLLCTDGTHFLSRVPLGFNSEFLGLWTLGDTGILNLNGPLVANGDEAYMPGNLPFQPSPEAIWMSGSSLKIAVTARQSANTNYSVGYMLTGTPSQLSGTVTLGDYVGSAQSQIVTIQVRNHGSTTPLDTYTAALDSTGHYSVTTVRSGTYDVSIQGAHWLRRVIPNVAFGSAGETANATLVNGDVNGDNVVSLADFNALRSAFGSSSGNGNWNANADLNGNGSVTLADFNILRSHFGQAGDN